MVYEKKIETYNMEECDFALQDEITVTITLNEYRSLVKQCAYNVAERAHKENVAALKERITALEKQIERMEREIEVIS